MLVLIQEKMKTASSLRTLPLMPKIEKELLKHKAQIEKNKQYFGKDYHLKYQDFVFVNELGDLVLPDHLTHAFKKIIRRNGLKEIRLHDLRHSCASIMLANGVQMKQIQEWLGHSNFSTTADVYSHLDFSAKIDSAEKIEKALGGKSKTSTEDKMTSFSELENKLQEIGIDSIDDLLKILASVKK